MFQMDEPKEPWQQAHERDGSFVTASSIGEYFVVRRATKEDRFVALISALTAKGLIEWREEVQKSPSHSDGHSYRAILPGTWEVILRHYAGQPRLFLAVSRGGDGGSAVFYQPQEIIRSLYVRLYETHGHRVLHFDARKDNPDLHVLMEREQEVITAGLEVLEQILAKVP